MSPRIVLEETFSRGRLRTAPRAPVFHENKKKHLEYSNSYGFLFLHSLEKKKTNLLTKNNYPKPRDSPKPAVRRFHFSNSNFSAIF